MANLKIILDESKIITRGQIQTFKNFLRAVQAIVNLAEQGLAFGQLCK